MDGQALRMAIYKNHASFSDFARAIGWSRQRLYRVTKGMHIPDVVELQEIATGLGISIESASWFFLPRKSPDEQLSSA